jgi:3(or 17)beta-hydroxysteroid dehydrogenase
MSGRLHGKVALITGGASGIGKACALHFAREGATVVLSDRNAALGATVAAELGAPHGFREHDVTDEAGWARVVDEVVATHGRLDILLNSAGIGTMGDPEHATVEDFRRMYAINVEGTFVGCRTAIRAMKKNAGGPGGSIINISSVAGLIGVPDLAGYCASKGAVRLLSKSVALYCARAGYNIRCNSVHPSFIDTPMVDAMAHTMGQMLGDAAKARAQLERAVPLRRMGHVDDVSNLIVFLAGDESRFITGGEHAVDGGLTAM